MTQVLFKVIKEHIEADKTYITEMIINVPSMAQLDLHVCSRLKGQIDAFETILDIHNFIPEEELEEKND